MTATTTVAAPAAATTPRTPAAPDSRESSSTPGGFDRQLDAARQRQQPAEDGGAVAAKTPPETATPAVQAVPAGVVAAVDGPAADDSAGDGDDQAAASALAGAMLALLGPSVAAALRPAGAPTAVRADSGAKTVATDAGAAALLQINGAPAAMAVAAAAMSPAAAGLLAGGHDAKLSPVDTSGEGSGHPATAPALPAVASHAVPAAVPPLQLQAPVGSQSFSQELGQQVAWLSGQDVKQARIRLHPEELGQLDIKVSVTHDRVDVVFSAQHPGAANAVQQSLAQLGQMLAQHGLSLGHAEVGQHDRGDRQGHGGNTAADTGVDEIGEVHAAGGAVVTGAVGLLDAFA